MMMKARGTGERWSALFPAGCGETRLKKKMELKGAKREGALTRKDKERGDKEKGGEERGGELVMTAR